MKIVFLLTVFMALGLCLNPPPWAYGLCAGYVPCENELTSPSDELTTPSDKDEEKEPSTDRSIHTDKYSDTNDTSGDGVEPNMQTSVTDCSRVYTDTEDGHFTIAGAEEEIKSPWLVAIGISRTNHEFLLLCSGSILTKKFILTAAHCFISKDERYQPSHVRVGANNIESYFAKQRKIMNVTYHPEYDRENAFFYYDVAIITVETDLKFTSRVSPICLPRHFSKHPGNDIGITVQGWGVTDRGQGKQTSQVTVIVRSKFECDDRIEQFGSKSGSENIERWIPQLSTDVLFCADANLNNKTGACHGDSGGPAIFR